MSGSRLVLAMLGGALAIGLLALAAFFLTREDNLLCVEGELQDNRVGPDGLFLPRTESFATVEEAQAFVCRRVPHPRNTGDLVLRDVAVVRTTNLGRLVEGDGRSALTFHYTEPGSDQPVLSVQASFPSQGAPDFGDASIEQVRVAGNEATLARPEQGVFVYWTDDSFDFAVSSTLADPQQQGELLQILDSTR